jgi:hypothetical protein
MECVGGGEVTEHPGRYGPARQLIGPVPGVPARAMGLVASGVQKVGIDEHQHSFPASNLWIKPCDQAKRGAPGGQFTPMPAGHKTPTPRPTANGR